MRLNTSVKFTEKTHEGAPAARMNPEQALRRSVLSCLLWENEFYENGKTIAERILDLSAQVKPEVLAALAVEARSTFNLRHVPLLLLKALAKHGTGRMVADAIFNTIQRADELAEFLAIYWQDGKKPLSNPMRKGLARAFLKFNEYQLAKYNRPGAVKLRDVLFLCHAKPKSGVKGYTRTARLEGAEKPVDEGSALFEKLATGQLTTPDTWESNLVAGKDKKETFERLIRDGNLGYFALLRNLRGMAEAGVDLTLIREAILARKGGAEKILPFRFVAAAKAAPKLEPEIDQAMIANLAQMPKLPGKTIVVIDVSGSMYGAQLSAKSDMTRAMAACALGAITRELCETPAIYATAGNDGTRIHKTQEVPARRGMALVDAVHEMCRPLGGGGIFLKQVMDYLYEKEKFADRIIVITDEQDCGILAGDSPLSANAFGKHNYLLNVASAKNGIGYGKFTQIDGFSEGVIRFIHEIEAND
jgi:60 kDa SS-A/Ro ribonucleoprotein